MEQKRAMQGSCHSLFEGVEYNGMHITIEGIFKGTPLLPEKVGHEGVSGEM